MLFVVYQAVHNGNVVYIGQGSDGRQHHVVSGTSHVYELNELHFLDKGSVYVEVLHRFATKAEAEAVAAEAALIVALKPVFNKKLVVKDRRAKKVVVTNRFKRNRYLKRLFDDLQDRFLRFYSVDEVFGGIPVSRKLPTVVKASNQLYLLMNALGDRDDELFRRLFTKCLTNGLIHWFHEDGVTYIKLSDEILDVNGSVLPCKADTVKHLGISIEKLRSVK